MNLHWILICCLQPRPLLSHNCGSFLHLSAIFTLDRPCDEKVFPTFSFPPGRTFVLLSLISTIFPCTPWCTSRFRRGRRQDVPPPQPPFFLKEASAFPILLFFSPPPAFERPRLPSSRPGFFLVFPESHLPRSGSVLLLLFCKASYAVPRALSSVCSTDFRPPRRKQYWISISPTECFSIGIGFPNR